MIELRVTDYLIVTLILLTITMFMWTQNIMLEINNINLSTPPVSAFNG